MPILKETILKEQIDKLDSLQVETRKLKELLLNDVYALATKVYQYRYPVAQKWKNFPKTISMDDINMSKDSILVLWDEYHCGETDYYNLSFPTSYFVMSEEQWHAIEDEDKKKSLEVIKAKEETAKQESLKRIREQDEKNFEILKNKLGK